MPRERSTEDRILALLARVPYPMECSELAAATDLTQRRIQDVLIRLEQAGTVLRQRGEPRGEESVGGRPASLWSVPGARLAPIELRPLLRSFPPDTIVVTPSGREARVIALDADGIALIQYLAGDKDGAEIRVQLLRAFQPGRARPEPVRVAVDA